MKRMLPFTAPALLLLIGLSYAVYAAVTFDETYVGAVLTQGAQQLGIYGSEAECKLAAKSRIVSQTTAFECNSRTVITATVSEDPPEDTDGDGVADPADQCPADPGPAPSGCPVVASATKFVLAGAGSTSCSASSPCSLQRAADISVPGDVILVAPGNYGPLSIARSGTQTQPIEYRASGTVAIENPNGYGIYLKRVSYVVLDGFTVQNTRLKAIASREATATTPVRGLTIRNCKIQNSRQEGMYLSQVADSVIEGNTITQIGLDGVDTTGHGIYLANAGSDGTTIRRNVIMIGSARGAALHINGDASQGGDGVISNLTIDSNVLQGGIKGISGDGLQTSRIVNNLIYDSSQHGIRAYRIDASQGPKGLVVVNNTVRTRTCASCSALKLSSDAGQSIAFNNILVSPDQLYGNLVQSKNIRTWAVDAQYYPLAAAKDQGVATFSGQSAPSVDLAGTVRSAPPSIGALE